MKKYYLCAYGHVLRVSPKVDSPSEAAKHCYGVTRNCYGVTRNVTVISIGKKNWKYLNSTTREFYIQQLKKLHKEKTGNSIQL